MPREYNAYVGVKYKVHKDLRKTFEGAVILVSKGGYGESSIGFTGFNTKDDYKGTFLVTDEEMKDYTSKGLLTELKE